MYVFVCFLQQICYNHRYHAVNAEQVAKELLPIVQKEPTLRQGSFSNAMEEVSVCLSACACTCYVQDVFLRRLC